MWEYILSSAAWSVAGLVVGFLLGRMERQIQDVKKKVENGNGGDHGAG